MRNVMKSMMCAKPQKNNAIQQRKQALFSAGKEALVIKHPQTSTNGLTDCSSDSTNGLKNGRYDLDISPIGL